ncbi:uncharacterized protein Dmul_10570 [Desulfococcus multivorans]|nr:uncharacterized protein Dmul_10570 [Desulfococcus multivorans]
MLDHLTEMEGGVFEIAPRMVVASKIIMGIAHSACFSVSLSQIKERPNGVGLFFENGFKGFRRLEILPLFELRSSQQEERLKIVGIDTLAAFQCLSGGVVLSVHEGDFPQILQHDGVKGFFLQGFSDETDTFSGAIVSGQGNAVAVEDHRIIRMYFKRCGHLFQGQGRVPVSGDQAGSHPAEFGVVASLYDRQRLGMALDPRIQIGEAIVNSRVRHQVRGNVRRTKPLLVPYFLEHGHHTETAVAGGRQDIDTQFVRLNFILATVGQKCRLGGGRRSDGERAARFRAAPDAQEDTGYHACQGGPLNPGCPLDSLANVARLDVGNLVGQNTGEFILIVHSLDQAAVDKNIAGRSGKGVVDILPDNVKTVLERLGWKLGQNFSADPVDVPCNGGIIDESVLSDGQFHELLTEGLLLLDRDAGGGTDMNALNADNDNRQNRQLFFERIYVSPERLHSSNQGGAP